MWPRHHDAHSPEASFANPRHIPCVAHGTVVGCHEFVQLMDWLSPPSAGECVKQSNLLQVQDEPSYPNRRVRVSKNSPFLQSCLASTVHLDDDPKSSTVQHATSMMAKASPYET